jgi:hypothetical protein
MNHFILIKKRLISININELFQVNNLNHLKVKINQQLMSMNSYKFLFFNNLKDLNDLKVKINQQLMSMNSYKFLI